MSNYKPKYLNISKFYYFVYENKVSISMEKDLHELVKTKVANSVFRNTSHLIEHAITQFMKEEK